MAEIIQIPLRCQIRDRIAEQLWSGSYSFGQDLNEAKIAAQLGVSRTPLREALIMLASEGLLVAKPNRGFHIPTYDADAVAQLYPVIGTLEALAVENLGTNLEQLSQSLDKLNGRLTKPDLSKQERYKTDAKWHQTLVAGCHNPTLIDEIEHLWNRSRTIDGALLRGIANTSGSCDEHSAISQAIKTRDLKRASQLIKQHWSNGIDVVINWLTPNRNGNEVGR